VYAQINVSSQLSYVWNASTNDMRGLQKTATNDRLAATWYATTFFTIDLNFSDGAAHKVALYCLDWDSTSRSQTLDIVDATTDALLDTRSVSSFNGGKYLVWDIRGHIRINVTKTGGESAVVGGLYFSSAASPVPTPTPTATPSPSPTATPTPTPAPLSLALVSSASTFASGLTGSPSVSEAQIATLVNSISQSYLVFLTEISRFNSTSEIDRELRASLYFARGAAALAGIHAPAAGIQNRLQIVAYHLLRATNFMSSGGVTELPPGAQAFAVGGTPVIGPAEALSTASFVPILAPAGLATILGDPNQSPLSTQTTYASLSYAGDLPYELNGVSVAIGGRAARLISVSPSRIYFCVPTGLPVGETEVIVTSQEGYVSWGMTTIATLVPGIFTVDGYGMGDAVVLNAVTLKSGEFNVTTPGNFGPDKQTRLMIFASGLSNGSSIFPNIAESVVVEARTIDNRIFQLPVEFVGPSGRSYGLDQINVRLIPELRGAGSVELVLVIAGQRSNIAKIKIL